MIHTGIRFIAFIGFSVFLATVSMAEPNMQEGMWAIKGEMRIEGLPSPLPPFPVNYVQCLTKTDMIPIKKNKNQDCTMVSNKIFGDEMTWEMQCKDKKGVTDSTGKITYKGETFTGTIHTVTKDTKGAKSESTMQLFGKRTGKCK